MNDIADEAVSYISRGEVERLAIEVLMRHNLTAVPIDPLLLAQREGIEVVNARFSDRNTVGMIAKRGEDVAILVNSEDAPYRKRFTIAHELGHHFLHLGGDGEFVDKEANLFRRQRGEDQAVPADRRREIQANLFAASLLMPESEVRRHWEGCGSIEELAKIFRVSEEAMGYRVDSLGID